MKPCATAFCATMAPLTASVTFPVTSPAFGPVASPAYGAVSNFVPASAAPHSRPYAALANPPGRVMRVLARVVLYAAALWSIDPVMGAELAGMGRTV